ncbi:MAG TPA: hypothetical protein VNL94_06760 [Candidatus Binatia bacterium]|nr:hypothetical protein [Candidatus Binatia bacterium]
MGLKTQDAAAVLNKLRAQATQVANDLYSVAGDLGEQYPPSYRRMKSREAIARVDLAIGEAGSRFGLWAAREAGDAKRRHRDGAEPGTEAETKRLRREMELQRLIQVGMLADDRTGISVVPTPNGGRRVDNGSAFDYAGRAEIALLAGDYETAANLAQASIALGGPATAHSHLAVAQEMLETPEQQEARKDLAKLDHAVKVFQREAFAAEATAYNYAAQTAEAIGDDHRVLAGKAIRAGMRAKLAALGMAEHDDNGEIVPGTYKEPILPQAPERKVGPIQRRATTELVGAEA